MDNLEQAIKKIKSEISRILVEDDEIVITDIIEKPTYWVFLYNSRKFVKTQNPSFMLLGNAPIIVEKKGLSIIETGTAYSLEYYLNLYEAGQLE